jgi:MoaA/NifB/PqqE/SkfB family radical SAM enzyme
MFVESLGGGKMITYYPWSVKVLEECLKAYDKGALPTLDLELTAKCTKASCIYCDSRPDVGKRHSNELNYREIERLIKNAKEMGLKWIYTCGLGEPLEDIKFRKMIDLIHELDIRISIFTNGMLIDAQKARWLHESGVYIILKLDTFDEGKYDRILGVRGGAKKIYAALNHLLDVGYGKMKEDYTDLAFSIVPTQLNYNSIIDVILYAKERNIFPSIGELEQSGRTLENGRFSELSVTDNQVKTLKGKVDMLLWPDYKRPICPTILTGVHIDNKGNCIVDRDTGLNCKWFLLGEPDVRIIGNIRQHDLSDLYDKVKEYRRECFENNKREVQRCENTDFVFGGCGGDPKEIIRIAREHLHI